MTDEAVFKAIQKAIENFFQTDTNFHCLVALHGDSVRPSSALLDKWYDVFKVALEIARVRLGLCAVKDMHARDALMKRIDGGLKSVAEWQGWTPPKNHPNIG